MNTIETTATPPISNAQSGMDSPFERGQQDKPFSIYQVHLDSWRRVPEEQNRPLTEAEIGPQLAEYVRFLRFTHVELLSSGRSSSPRLDTLTRCLREAGMGVLPDAGSCFVSPWDRDWAYRTLRYFGYDPLYRKFHHDLISERADHSVAHLVLPLSHELVTQDKASLLARMPGDEWQKFANLRLLFAYMYALPGKKLIFMGGEFGQLITWNPATSLDWHLVRPENLHGRLQHWVADLNRLYRGEPALHQTGAKNDGFAWIDTGDAEQSVISFLRRSATGQEIILAVFNFTPVPRHNYRVGAPLAGFWTEVLNSDALEYGGSGQGNLGGVEAAPFGWQRQSHSLFLTLPPLAAVFFKASQPASQDSDIQDQCD